MGTRGRPARTSWPPCKVEGCTSTSKGGSFGFCHTHYVAVRRGQYDRETGAPLRAPMRVPSYGGTARCLVDGCLRRPKGRDLCAMHYQQWEDGLLAHLPVPDRSVTKSISSYAQVPCLVENCSARPVNRGMCSKHTQQREAGIIDKEGRLLRDPKSTGRHPKEGPIVDGAGYVLVVAPPGYTGPTRYGRVLEHRLVMEQSLGRLLHGVDSEFYEVVHHKDGNKMNNNLSNLELRTMRTHPPGHEASVEQLEAQLDALRQNQPEMYEELLRKRGV